MTDKSEFNWKRFDLYHYYDCSREQLFKAWATAEGLESFFIDKASHSSENNDDRAPDEPVRSGDSYLWQWIHDFTLDGHFTEVRTNEQVSFMFGRMHVDVRLFEAGDRQLLKLTQTAIPDSDESSKAHSHMNCRTCWAYFLTNLKSVIEHGHDLRERRADRSDSIGVSFFPPELSSEIKD